MNKQLLTLIVTMLLTASLPALPTPAHAAPLAQDDPVAQCAEGVRLFFNGQHAEALPLLEAGFNDRQEAIYAAPDDLGMCALVLGLLRGRTGNQPGTLEAYAIAREIFQASGNRWYEGTTLNNIGAFYQAQGRYAESLEAYQDSLAIWREVDDPIGEGKTLSNIGVVYDCRGHYAEALASYQQALTIRRKVGDRAGEGTTLGNIGVVYDHQGRPAEALEYHQQALAIRREVGDRAGEGTTLDNIGAVHHAQGHYAEALDYFQQALAIEQEVGDRAGEGTTLGNIGAVHHAQGHYAEALDYYQQALTIEQEVGDRAGEGTTLGGIGAVHHAQGHYAEALDYYQQALTIEQEVGDWAGEGIMLDNIGVVYAQRGRPAEALEYHQHALAILREVGDRAGEATTLNNMGAVHIDQGRYGEALASHQQALAIQREVGDRAGEGTTLDKIGVVYAQQGRPAEALDCHQQALAILREVGDRAGEATTLNNIGAAYQVQRRYAEALEAYQQALAILREVGDRVGEARTLSNIGVAYDSQGRYDEALNYYQQALTIRREVGDRAGEGRTLNNIGVVYDSQGRHDEALDYYQQALTIRQEVADRAGEGVTLSNLGFTYQQQREGGQALAYYEQAMEVFDSLRAIAGSEAGRAAFIAQHAGLHDLAVGLYHQQGQDEAAFYTSERGRARGFLDSLTTGYVELSDQESADLQVGEQDAYAARQTVQDALARARALDPPDAELVADLEAQLAEAEKEHGAALAAIEARHDQLAALVPGRSAVLELADVQALLEEKTTLVSYYVLGDEGALVFVITHDSFTTVDLPDATPENLRTALAGLYQWPNLEEPNPQPLRDLHTWLIAPLADQLHTPMVGIIPHQSLHYVPFVALTDGQTYLGEQHTLFTLPSASALTFIQTNASAAHGTGALVFGNPATSDANLRPLPHAADEAAAVADLLGVMVYTEADATESRFRLDVDGVQVVHLGAHGSYNTTNPLYSVIHLAPGGEDDGRLEVHEVYGLDLKATDLVVLSACESQIGELSAGDEVVGLTRAFFFAGTPTVIASLWSVDDAATEDLMVAFYRHWQAGMGKAEALQAVQAEVRETHPSPFYWAAFVLSGDPGTAPPAEPTVTPSLPPTSSAKASLTPAPTSMPAEREGGGICPLAALMPLVLLGLWGVKQRWKV